MKEENKKIGRPLLYKEPMKRINLMLDKDTHEKCKRIGGGCASMGVRKAVKNYKGD